MPHCMMGTCCFKHVWLFSVRHKRRIFKEYYFKEKWMRTVAVKIQNDTSKAWKYDKSLLKPHDSFVWETDRYLVIVHWKSWLCAFTNEVIISSSEKNRSFESDIFSETVDPVHKTDLNDPGLIFNLMNQWFS